MSESTMTQPEGMNIIDEQRHGHRFFDPRSPEQPEEVFGVETEAIMRLGRAAIDLGALPSKVNLGLYALSDALRLVPLVEEMQSGVSLRPEDVRPYRKPIKKLSLGLSFTDKVAASAGAIGVGIPMRRALNNRIEREFPERAAEAIGQAREAVASIESDVDFLASFENPKEEFVSELNELAQTVTKAIVHERDGRVRRFESNINPDSEPEIPHGVAGFFTKVARKVRNFFGIFQRNRPAVNPHVTAYDAGAGIESTLNNLIANKNLAEARMPMLSKLVLDRLPKDLPLTKDRLALVAPEILNFVFSTSPIDEKSESLMRSIDDNPHELRFVTRFKKHYGRYSLEGIQRASFNLLPAIRDVLPSEGSKVREIYEHAQDLLQQTLPEERTVGLDIKEDDIKVSKNFRSRLRKRFTRSRNK